VREPGHPSADVDTTPTSAATIITDPSREKSLDTFSKLLLQLPQREASKAKDLIIKSVDGKVTGLKMLLKTSKQQPVQNNGNKYWFRLDSSGMALRRMQLTFVNMAMGSPGGISTRYSKSGPMR